MKQNQCWLLVNVRARYIFLDIYARYIPTTLRFSAGSKTGKIVANRLKAKQGLVSDNPERIALSSLVTLEIGKNRLKNQRRRQK